MISVRTRPAPRRWVLFYLIGAREANVLRFFGAIFTKKFPFFLRNGAKSAASASRKRENGAIIDGGAAVLLRFRRLLGFFDGARFAVAVDAGGLRFVLLPSVPSAAFEIPSRFELFAR